MIANGGRLENAKVGEIMNRDGITTHVQLTSSHRGHNTVFRKDGICHYIKQEAIDYYNSL
jgi:hypothetical protein